MKTIDEYKVIIKLNILIAFVGLVFTILNSFIFKNNNIRYFIYGVDLVIIIQGIVGITISSINIKRLKIENESILKEGFIENENKKSKQIN